MIRTCIAALLLFPMWASADPWSLDGANSTVSFVSLKNVDIAEAHSFGQLSGSISDGGELSVEIALDSVDTKVDIRDQRMREHLFGTEQFPSARISGQVERQAFVDLKPGQSVDAAVRIELEFRGTKTPYLAPVKVSAIDGNMIQAVSSEPILVSARALGVADGVDKLRELAGLQSISMAVPVYFSLRFKQTP